MFAIFVVLLELLPRLVVGDYGLQLACDCIVLLDYPITFSAHLKNSSKNTDFLYLFKDNVIPSSVWFKRDGSSTNLTVIYSDSIHKPGNYSMKVAVSDYRKIVAIGKISFTITDRIPVSLTFIQEGLFDKAVGLLVTRREVGMVVTIHDPRNYFTNSTILYTWEVDNYRISTPKPYLTYNFTYPGTFEVTATVIAKVTLLPLKIEKSSNIARIGYKWGFSKEIITVKAPVDVINVTGQTWLPHRQILDLNVSCAGSGPYAYCWKIFPDADDKNQNLTCMDPVVTNDCSFPIIHYFSQPGNYHIKIHINNFVAFQWKNVKVYVYDVSHRPQLSVVILPVVCTILAIIIVAGGLLYYYHSRKKVQVETADFDFLQSSNNLIILSFWEQFYISIKSKIFCFPQKISVLSDDTPILDENFGSIQ